jgi:DNA-binding MarR family transcriptional regulator
MSPAAFELLVLNGVRLKGFAECGVLASALGLEPHAVERVLADLRDRGLVLRREGRVSGWTLTPAGRGEHARLVADELDEAGCEPEIQSAYADFLQLNPRLLAAASAWQVRDIGGKQATNDHADAAYDKAVIGELRQVHDGVKPLVDRLTGCLDRFGRYGPRLDAALGSLEAGELDWFTKPLIDSYHTIWFELHEDLLATLGKERSQESKEMA